MLKLYYAPGTIALATHIALVEAGAEYEAVRLDFSKKEQLEADYLAINPKGRVPTLVTERGIITETPAVLAYIAQSFPEAGLAPLDDPFALARIQEFNCYLCATLHVAHAHRMRGHRWADDPLAIADMKRKVPEAVGACFEMIENGFFQGPWVMGEAYSICDPYLFTVATWMDSDGLDPASFPKILAHQDRMKERPGVQKTLAEHFG